MSAILVPLDGSELARRALPFATALAERAGRPLILLRAISTLANPTMTDAMTARHDTASELEAEADRLRATGLTVETEVIEDEPASAILDAVAEHGAELLVMSTHGRGGLGRWLFGSVADSVLRRAPVPVLLIRPVGQPAWSCEGRGTILVPLDGSPLAEAALGPACELADTLKAGLYLVRSVPFSRYATYAEGYAFSDSATTERELKLARAYLEEVAARLRAARYTVDVRAMYGSPFLDVATVAREVGAQAIVMATHGRSGITRALLGSVATATVRRADIPVLLVRPLAADEPALAAEEPIVARPAAPTGEVTLTVSPDELDTLLRALGERFHHQPVDRRHSEPTRRLLEKLRAARETRASPTACR